MVQKVAPVTAIGARTGQMKVDTRQIVSPAIARRKTPKRYFEFRIVTSVWKPAKSCFTLIFFSFLLTGRSWAIVCAVAKTYRLKNFNYLLLDLRPRW